MTERISVILRTAEHRGDHDADVARAYDVPPETTVGELVARLLPVRENPNWQQSDWLEIRIAQPLPEPNP